MADFSGYYNKFQQNVYGTQQGSYAMNNMMVQANPTPQIQGGGQQQQEESPWETAANAYSIYDKASSLASSGSSSTPIMSSSSGGAAYGSGTGVYPVAAEGTGMWAGSDMGASTMTGYTPVAGSSTVGSTGTVAGSGTAAGGTAAGGTAGGSAAGSSAATGAGEGAGYGLGWWLALAAAVNYSTNKDYYNWGDVFTGDAVWKKMENAGRTEQLNEFIPGLGDWAEGGTRKLSLNPKQHAEGWSQQAHVLDDKSNSIARANYKGADQFSQKTLVEPTKKTFDKSVEITKKTLNPFKWFD